DRFVTLSVGSDDGVKVWLNGELVIAHDVPRSAAPDQDRAKVHLRAGDNTLLMKVVNLGGGSAFYFRIRPKTGDELSPRLETARRRTPDGRDERQRSELRAYYRRSVSTEGQALVAAEAKAKMERDALFDAIPETMVMEEKKEPRATHLLMRGNFQRPG